MMTHAREQNIAAGMEGDDGLILVTDISGNTGYKEIHPNGLKATLVMRLWVLEDEGSARSTHKVLEISLHHSPKNHEGSRRGSLI